MKKGKKYLSSKRNLLEVGFVRFHPPAVQNFNHFYRDPIFDELIYCDNYDPTDLYFVPIEIYLEQAPYLIDSDQNGSHWLKTML